MNVLKALAKMTQLAADLFDKGEHMTNEYNSLVQKYDDTVKVASERYDLIKALEAKLYAAERNATSDMHFAAAVKLNDLGHAWDEPGKRWVDPLPAAPSATPPIAWELHPWATHFLECGFSHVLAELVDGKYQADPESDTGRGRLCYHVGLKVQDFKVVATRPGYQGPRTRGLAAPVMPERDDTPSQLPWPKEPAGGRWRNSATTAAPRNMDDHVDVLLLLNGKRRTGPGREFQWGTDVSTGVAWWRFNSLSATEAGQPE